MKDNPKLQTFDDIVKALPPSTGVVALDNFECLLPPEKRDLAGAREFVKDLNKRYRHRGFQIIATVTDNNLPAVVHEVIK